MIETSVVFNITRIKIYIIYIYLEITKIII